MKKITVYCNSGDETSFTVEPGGDAEEARLRCYGNVVLLDLARVRELKKYFTRLEQEIAKRPKPVEEKPKKWVYGEKEES